MRRRWTISLFAVLFLLAGIAPRASAQDSDAYLRALAEHFEIPSEEVGILSEWTVPAAEIPVVLFVSDRGGASRDALLALRRRGQSWISIAARFQLDAGSFHYPLAALPSGGVLATTYGSFAETSRAEWRGIELADTEVVALVNLRFIAEHLGVDPSRVAEEMASGDSPAAVLRRLGG